MSAAPAYKPQIEVRPRLNVVNGARPKLGALIAIEAFTFAVIVLFVFGASSLLGQVKVEDARRAGIRAEQRMKVAQDAQAVLAKQIESLSDYDRMRAWALNSGMIAPDLEARPSLKNGVYARR